MNEIDTKIPRKPKKLKSEPAMPIADMDEVDYQRMEIEHRINIGGTENNANEIEKLKSEGRKIQNKFKDWILKAVFEYYNVKIPNLVFDFQSPWLAPEKDIIYFKVIDVRSGAKFLVVGDLNKAGNITEYRVAMEK
ncbi:hypothetical protein JW911_01410 [Candidatus Peregrinibacteria bacterium]|nr:hypothetical protein [Candidatus Peregrinibacteria bacterium]